MSQEIDAAFGEIRRDLAKATSTTRLHKAKLLRGRLFAEQLEFVNDPARRKTLLCPRRAGKTFSVIADACISALETRVAHWHAAYVTLVRDTAKRLFWEPLLALNKELELDIQFHHADLVARFPHGPKITLRGAENDADVEKFRGPSYDRFYIDEAGVAAFAGRLPTMIKEVVTPALADRRGTLVLQGTPGAILAGTFYEATGPSAFDIEVDEEGKRSRSRPWDERDLDKWQGVEWTWSAHHWTQQSNVKLPHLWTEALADKRRWGWKDDSPQWVREYLGRWMADDSRLVFRYGQELNDWEPPPPPHSRERPFGLPTGHTWHYVIGCDMGFRDPFALQMFSHSDTHPDAYQVYEWEARGLSVTQIAAAVKVAIDLAGGEDHVDALVGDFVTLGDAIHAELAQQHGLVFEKAEKKDKRDFTELFNTELLDGRIHVIKGSRLGAEMLFLSWDDTGLKEKGAQPNHNSDAARYIVRRLRHRDAVTPTTQPPRGSPEQIAAQEAEEIERVEEQARRKRRRDGYDAFFDDDAADQDTFSGGDDWAAGAAESD